MFFCCWQSGNHCSPAGRALLFPHPWRTAHDMEPPAGSALPFPTPQHCTSLWGAGTAPSQVGSTPEKESQQCSKSPRGSGEGRHLHRSWGLHPSPYPRDAHQPAHVLPAVASLPQQLRIFHSSTYLQYLPALTI